MPKNLYLDPTTNDLALLNYNLRITRTNTEYLSQKIENKLRFFYGEWFANQFLGIPYYTRVLIKQADLNEVNSLLQNEVKKITGVADIITFEVDFDSPNRTYSVTMEVLSDEEQLVTVSLTI